MRRSWRRLAAAALGSVLFAALAGTAQAAGTVGTTFPAGFPTITDLSLGTPVLGFGAAGPVRRTPVIFLHGNNDTPFPTSCNPYGQIHAIAQYLADHGYATSELWGLGYQGDQCDTLTTPTNKSAFAHSTVANLLDLDRFVHAVLAYTGARRVDIVGHSLGVTLARTWMKLTGQGALRAAAGGDRRAEPRHHRLLAKPAQLLPAARLRRLHARQRDLPRVRLARLALPAPAERAATRPGPDALARDPERGPDFVYASAQDGFFPPVPAEDSRGRPHDFSASAQLAGAEELTLTGQGAFDPILGTSHLGIVNSPATWAATLAFLTR